MSTLENGEWRMVNGEGRASPSPIEKGTATFLLKTKYGSKTRSVFHIQLVEVAMSEALQWHSLLSVICFLDFGSFTKNSQIKY